MLQFNYILTLFLTALMMVSCTNQANSAKTPVSVTPQSISNSQLPKTENLASIKSGTFVSGEHETKGKVAINRRQGKTFLELDQSFKTSSSGPDLVVVLHRSDNVIGSTKPPSYPLKEGDYLVISRLQKFNGSQIYVLPKNINIADYKSVAIWCRKFNATFGVAKLSNS
ncbi:MAG TPA: DM13 domain-containing protein [Nostocaceae cyanobacterium]|nr:DM13 domain-containing protein [Nostocaceae cyanobacterium]